MTIGETIRQLRREKDITQEQLAEALGITSRAVSQWENGRTAPDISQLPALANFFDVTTDHLLGVDIDRREEEIERILKHIRKYQEQGDAESTAKYLREQLKIYPNQPQLLTNLAAALQDYYFAQGKAETDEQKKEISDEIVSLCERALRYCKPADDSSFPKQVLIYHYLHYLNDKEKARDMVMSLPNITCTREMFAGELYEGKEALAQRQSTLLRSLTHMMHNMFRNISCDDEYSPAQKIEILKADDAVIKLVTGGKPNYFHCILAVNSAMQAVYFLKLGDEEKALEMLEAAYSHADSFETRPDGERFAPCWLSELVDNRGYIHKNIPDTAYDSIYHIIVSPENRFCETFEGNARFEKLMEKLREKISR
ncbi:helix-turn-helix domain-containing protein [uncultured Ruminococcus sp.]|uniref:helix-turn-helix domain-containing protein n=1 Tax=uncultured Ruminococcus sp. TaxID=165186 RepID=UPI0025D51C9E|nr:helix-turn-helix transcriptional regulator [uncultured Ruminococcus sp.]